MKKALLLVLILILCLIVGCGNNQVNAGGNDIKEDVTKVSEEKEMSKNIKSKLVIGKKEDMDVKAKVNNFEITLTKYRVGYNAEIYEEGDEKGNLAYLYFTIKNNNKESKEFFAKSYFLVTDKGTQLDAEYDSTISYIDSIYTGATKEAEAYFIGFDDDEKPLKFVMEFDDFVTKSTYEYDFSKDEINVKTLIRCGNFEYAESESDCSELEKIGEQKFEQEQAEKYKCEDGTSHESCSKNKPKYCSYGTLSDNAEKCGCPTGYEKDGYYDCKAINTNLPIGFDSVSCSKSESVVKCNLNLIDASGEYVKTEGKLNFEVVDVFGSKLYEKSFNLKPEDYQGYSDKYEFVIPLSEIGKDYRSRTDVTFKFTIGDKLFESKDDYSLNTYSDEKKKELLEERYNNNANTKEKTITKGDFKVTLLKRGVYEDVKYSDVEKYMRFDVKVENIANEKVAFYGRPKITIASTEYSDYYYYSTFKTGMDFYNAGQIKEGYVLFEEEDLVKLPMSDDYTFMLGTDYTGIGDYAGMTYTYQNEYPFELS
jgi:hypothetical protein